jgi:hypothetical protein
MDFWLDLRGLINPKPNQPLPLMTPFMQFIGSIGQLNGSLINSDFESPKKKTSMSPVTQRYRELKTGSLEKRTAAAEFARGPGALGGWAGKPAGETGRGFGNDQNEEKTRAILMWIGCRCFPNL